MAQEKSLEDLKGAVENLHTYLRTHIRHDRQFLPSPFMVEFCGSSDAGKSTCVNELNKFLSHNNLRVLIPQEGAEVIRHIGRGTPEYNLRTGMYALQMLCDYAHTSTYDVVIFDRSIFDSYAWMTYWHEKGSLSEEEKNTFQQIFLSRFWTDRINASFVFVCEPNVAVERGARISVEKNNQGAMSTAASISKSVDRYKKMFSELSSKYPQLELVDTTHMSEQEMSEHIARRAMDAFLNRISAKKA